MSRDRAELCRETRHCRGHTAGGTRRVRGAPVLFRVSIDGEPPRVAFGSDVDAEGAGLLDQQRMYQLVRQQGPVAVRTFGIEFLDRGAEAFAFTFG